MSQRRRCRSADCRVCRFAGCQPAVLALRGRPRFVHAADWQSAKQQLGNLRYDNRFMESLKPKGVHWDHEPVERSVPARRFECMNRTAR